VKITIDHWINIDPTSFSKNGHSLLSTTDASPLKPEEVYKQLQYSYPKFFKMDALCKWAWLGAEALLTGDKGTVYDGVDKKKIAVVLFTAHGCLDVDKRYKETMSTIPSPALFVYTLSNIMLGEICIRHGFKGEQTCLVQEQFDKEELAFWVNEMIVNRGMDACLCGWVDATSYQQDVRMFWVKKDGDGLIFSSAAMQ